MLQDFLHPHLGSVIEVDVGFGLTGRKAGFVKSEWGRWGQGRWGIGNKPQPLNPKPWK